MGQKAKYKVVNGSMEGGGKGNKDGKEMGGEEEKIIKMHHMHA